MSLRVQSNARSQSVSYIPKYSMVIIGVSVVVSVVVICDVLVVIEMSFVVIEVLHVARTNPSLSPINCVVIIQTKINTSLLPIIALMVCDWRVRKKKIDQNDFLLHTKFAYFSAELTSVQYQINKFKIRRPDPFISSGTRNILHF